MAPGHLQTVLEALQSMEQGALQPLSSNDTLSLGRELRILLGSEISRTDKEAGLRVKVRKLWVLLPFFFFFNKPDILSLLPCSFPPLIGEFGITTPVNYSSQPAFAKVAAHVMNSPNLPDLALSGCKLATCKNRGSADERWPQHFLLQTVSG